MYEASLSCSPTLTYMPTQNEKQKHILPNQHTGIVDSGATYLYISPTVSHWPPDISASKIKVGTANGQVETSAAKATLPIPQLAEDFPTTGYIMPSFTNTLIGVGPIYYANCTVIFKKKYVTVLSPEGKKVLTGWREKNCQGHGVCSQTKRQYYNRLKNNKPDKSCGAQFLRPAKHGIPSQIYACGSRIPS